VPNQQKRTPSDCFFLGFDLLDKKRYEKIRISDIFIPLRIFEMREKTHLNYVKKPISPSNFRGGCRVNTDYLKVPIFPDFVDFSPISLPYFPILCKLHKSKL